MNTTLKSGSTPAAGQCRSDRHRRGLPPRAVWGVLVEDLEVSADTLDADMQRMDGFEAADEHRQREDDGGREFPKSRSETRDQGPPEQGHRQQGAIRAVPRAAMVCAERP